MFVLLVCFVLVGWLFVVECCVLCVVWVVGFVIVDYVGCLY